MTQKIKIAVIDTAGATDGHFLKNVSGTPVWAEASGGVGVTDGDKGDITVSATGSTWTVDNGAITLAKMADVATGTVFYRKTAATGAPEVQTLATLKTDLGLTGTNTGDQTITLTGDVTGSGDKSFAATLATVNSNTGSFGSATAVPAITVNAKGLITAVSTNAITPAGIGAIPASEKGTANGVATLGADSKIPTSQLPALAITSTTVAANQTAHLAVVAQEGDVVVRTDLNKSYIHNGGSAGTMADWQELLTPTDTVTSVNGYTGAVSLTKSDIGLANVDNTSDANKPVSSATQSALNTKASLTDAGAQNFTGPLSAPYLSTPLGASNELGYVELATGTVSATGYVNIVGPSSAYSLAIGGGLVNSRVWFETWGTATGIEFNSTPYVGTNVIYHAGNLTKSTLGLGNVDNTSDANKPVSTAQQTALNLKANLTGATFSGSVTATNISGTNTGDQTTITGNAGTATALQTSRNFSISGGGITAAAVGFNGSANATLSASVDAGHITLARMANLAANSIIGNNTGSAATPIALTAAQVRTLINVANGATANQTDAYLLDRSYHTGSQLGNTITGSYTSCSMTLTNGRLLGNSTGGGGSGAAAEISIGSGLSLTGGTLAMADVATGTVFYRKTAATGAPEVQTLATLKTDLGLTGTNTGDQTITLTGPVTGTGTGSFATSITNNAVTNTMLAQVATATFKGRTTASTGNVEDLTVTQATAMLNAFTSTLKGLAPASGGGTTNFLRADGTWAQPAGGGGDGGTATVGFTDIFTGDGTTTGFTMSATVADVKHVLVTVNGIAQLPTTHYTVSGTGLTMGVAPPSGASIMVRQIVNVTAAIAVELAVSAIGKPTAGQKLVRYIASRACTLDQSLSRGDAGVAATGSPAVFTVKKNDVQIATYTFAVSATVATISITDTAIAAGDVITIEAPASQNATLEDIALTLAGSR